MTSPEIPKAADVFFCPHCGQKHRGDLSAPRAGAEIRATCAGCGEGLWIRWKRGRASVKLASSQGTLLSMLTTSQIEVPANLERTAALVGAVVVPRRTDPGRLGEAAEGFESSADVDGDAERPRRPGAAPARRPREKGRSERTTPADAEFPVGTMIGRYRVAEAIGRGGTGSVYRAFDATTNRDVALKIIGASQPDVMRQRFLREIEVQANLRHPNLMPIFDRGEHDGRPFVAMEMLYRPFTLTEIVTMARNGSLSRYATLKHLESSETLVRDVFLPLCEAMQVANVENGVVHRDLKPDNVLVDSRTLRPYVIDFGICHVLERRSRIGGVVRVPTAEDAGIVGTPRYLAPEQARGTVHECTDLWGLGAILRFCLTGEPPVAGAQAITRAELKRRVRALTDAQAVARRDGDEAKASLCAEKLARLEDTGLRTYDDVFEDAREGVYTPLPPDTPAPAVAILRMAMAPRPGDRYVNPRALAADVSAWLAGAPTVAHLAQATSTGKVVRGVRSVLRREVVLGLLAVTAVGVSYGVGRFSERERASESRADAWKPALASIEQTLDAAAQLDPDGISSAEAARTHDTWVRSLEALTNGRTAAEGSTGRVEALAPWRALGARIAPQRVVVEAPTALQELEIEDLTRRRPPTPFPTAGLRLAPGEYVLTVGPVRLPLRVPLWVRPRGAAVDREGPLHRLRLPIDPNDVPASMTLVVPEPKPVGYRGPPWSAPAAAPVAPFLVDTLEVTSGDWEAFLDAVPDDAERARLAEAVDFVRDLSQGGRYIVPRGAGADANRRDFPVRGVTPADATRYCAWRSLRDGATVRLPTEAEWAAAAGATVGGDFAAGSVTAIEDGPASVQPVGNAPDVSPYGVRGMLGNTREIVLALAPHAGPGPEFLSKGAGVGDRPADGAIRLVRPIGRDERDTRTGFRCVRELREPEGK